MAKMLEDGMVNAKIIPGDDPKYVKETTFRSMKGESDMVLITIKEPEE
jgi:hypothetical protein